MRVLVKLFGAVREAVGAKELGVELADAASAAELRALLARDHPIFEDFGERLAVSVNLEVVPHDTPLRDGDEVAFLPPVAGGAGSCWMSDRPLDVGEAVRLVSGPGMGGLVTFLGAVRDRARGRDIRHLEYEAYPEMAEAEMRKLAQEAASRFEITAVALVHRTGRLEIGEASVAVAVAAPHRGAACDACRFVIDALKRTVPIWKKEFFEGGQVWIEGGGETQA